ncbi:MAG: hypothetical protein WCG93_12065 [Paludibacter sp.]
MEKQNYDIGQVFTHDEKNFKTQASKVGGNLCKGCYFRDLIAAQEDENIDFWACNAPENLSCTRPDRIFKHVK